MQVVCYDSHMSDYITNIQSALSSRTSANTWNDYKIAILEIIYNLQDLHLLPKESVYLHGSLRPIEIHGSPIASHVVSYTLQANHALDIAEQLAELEILEFCPPYRKEILFGDKTCVEGRSSLPPYVPSIHHPKTIPDAFFQDYRRISGDLLNATSLDQFLTVWNAHSIFWMKLYCRSLLPPHSDVPSLELKQTDFSIGERLDIQCMPNHFTEAKLTCFNSTGIFTFDAFDRTLHFSSSFLKNSLLGRNLEQQIAIWEVMANPSLHESTKRNELRMFLQSQWLYHKASDACSALEIPQL